MNPPPISSATSAGLVEAACLTKLARMVIMAILAAWKRMEMSFTDFSSRKEAAT